MGSEERNSLEIAYSSEEEKDSEQQVLAPSGHLKLLAEAVSVVLHPVIVPSIIFAIVFYFSPTVAAPLTDEARLPMLGLLGFSTFFIPLSWLMMLRYFGGLPSLQMMDRRERPGPFLSISIFYGFITYLFISKYPIYTNIISILTGITLILILLTCISFYWKISAHSAAISGAAGFLAAFALLYQDSMLLFPLSAVVVLAGAAMSARLYLQVHQPAEVWVGAVLGFFVSFCTVFLFLFLFI